MRNVAGFALTLGFTGFVAASCGGVIATSSPFSDAEDAARADGEDPLETGADAVPLFPPDTPPTPPPRPPAPDGGPLPRIACGDAGSPDAAEQDGASDASRRDGGEECPTTTVCANEDFLIEYQGGTCAEGKCVYRASTTHYCGTLCRCVLGADGAVCGDCVIPI